MASLNRQHNAGDAGASLACYLPSIRHAHATPGAKRRMSARVSCDTQKFKQLCAQDENGARNLLQTAWALVLHHYTGMPEVCFGYDELDMAISARPKSETSSSSSAVTVRIDQNMLLSDFQDQLRKGKEGKYGGKGKSQLLHFNTAVMLQTRSSSSDNAPSPAAMSFPDEVILGAVLFCMLKRPLTIRLVQGARAGKIYERCFQHILGMAISRNLCFFCVHRIRDVLQHACKPSRQPDMHYSGIE